MNDLGIIINWLYQFAEETWQRIHFTRRIQRGRIHETTITQNMVFQLYWKFRCNQLPFELWEAKDEKANGNDLELAVETVRGYILLPCQVKIVKPDNKYGTMDYGPSHRLQIEALLDHAQQIRGWPMYLLYNHCTDGDHVISHWQNQYERMVSYGCSLVPARYLYNRYCPMNHYTGQRKWQIPSFMDLHPLYGSPWHEAIAFMLSNPMMVPSQWREDLSLHRIQFYNYDELYSGDLWDNLNPPPRISGIPNMAEEVYEELSWGEDNQMFHPRYRIVIPRSKRGTPIWRIS